MWPLAVLAVCLAQAAAPADPAAEGRKALEAEKYDVAAEWLEKAVQTDPKDYAAQFHLALANTMLGRNAEAIAGYRKVLELKPDLYEAELNLGMVLLRTRQPREAAPYLEKAAAGKPKEFRPRLYLGDAQFDSGEWAKAEESYKAALGLDGKSGAAELGLGRAQARQSRLDEAEAHYRRAIELDASLKPSLLELAEMCEKAGSAPQAIAIYGQFPDNAGARERLGQLLVEAGRPAEAIPHLEWAVRNSPTAANRLALAQAYRKNKQPEKELPLLEQAVAAEPNDADLRLGYGRELRDQRRFADAARQFSLVAQAKPDSVEAWNELAAMLVQLENYPQALAVLDHIRAMGAEAAGHLYLRAIMLDRTRDRKGAIESYRKFLAASQGKNPNEEFKARQRIHILELDLGKR
jgi:tetratricopeptide (TPR) repeat protein